MRVAHLTSVHPRYDGRIWAKECRSLVEAGLDVTLVVADALGEETRDGVRIIGVGAFASRWRRMMAGPRRVLRKAREVDAEIYHLHDPELLTIALDLKRSGKRVIFDAHEDFPKQVLGKHYLGSAARVVVAGCARAYEARVCGKLDAVVAAWPAVGRKFASINPETVVVNNYPVADELRAQVSALGGQQDMAVCYVGGMTAIRGLRELVEAMGHLDGRVRLRLGGSFAQPGLAEELRALPAWKYVDELGWLTRPAVRDVMSRCLAGVATYLPSPNHGEAQPTKLFEYMSAGLPVISSHFPAWREVIEGNQCGICVDPADPGAIAEAIRWVVDNPAERTRMGTNGRRAVEERYNWGSESRTLVALYERLSRTR